jgi:hypothetical protein
MFAVGDRIPPPQPKKMQHIVVVLFLLVIQEGFGYKIDRIVVKEKLRPLALNAYF